MLIQVELIQVQPMKRIINPVKKTSHSYLCITTAMMRWDEIFCNSTHFRLNLGIGLGN
jgi:hypothetical protein